MEDLCKQLSYSCRYQFFMPLLHPGRMMATKQSPGELEAKIISRQHSVDCSKLE